MKNLIIAALKDAMKGVKESSWNVTEPSRGRTYDSQREALRLARETKNIKVEPMSDDKEAADFGKKVLVARGIATELKRDVAGRAKNNQKKKMAEDLNSEMDKVFNK